VHLRTDLHLLNAVQNRTGCDCDGPRRRRHLPMGFTDGGRDDRLPALGHTLCVLRRALRLGNDRGREGISLYFPWNKLIGVWRLREIATRQELSVRCAV